MVLLLSFSWWQNNCQSSAQDNVGVRYIECLYSSYLDQSTDSLQILFFVLLLSMAVSSITLYTLPLAFMLNSTSFFFSFLSTYCSDHCFPCFFYLPNHLLSMHVFFNTFREYGGYCNWLDDLQFCSFFCGWKPKH